ncbi:MAG: hypothetical protein ACYCUM_00390 [Solirubrobacteraceae bacterium]
MPQFCRHKRFVERCPICSEELARAAATSAPPRARGDLASRRMPSRGARAATGRRRPEGLRVYGDGVLREREDGYDSPLLPGLRASEDARRLARELAFSAARIAWLRCAPEGSYAEVARLARAGELERASTLCFLLAYLSPLESDTPFASIELAAGAIEAGELDTVDFDSLALGPRSAHVPGSGVRMLRAHEAWARRAGSQRAAYGGDPEWSGERRFGRAFERLSVHGLTRAARFELLVTLGALGVHELAADSLHLAAATGAAALPAERLGEPVLTAGKRVLGIGDALTLERRAAALAQATAVPLEALDLALFNWAGAERATLGAGMLAIERDRAEQIAATLGV